MDRLKAVSDLEGNWAPNKWLITAALAVLVILSVLLLVSVLYRKIQEKVSSKTLLLGQARKKGLSDNEQRILLEIADSRTAANKNAVLTTEDAFNEGAGNIIQRAAKKGKSPEELKQLQDYLSSLKKRLGFIAQQTGKTETDQAARQKGTEQIPVGMKVYITRRTWRFDEGLETTVIENNKIGLKVETSKKVKVNFGDKWRACYSYGTSIWGFDTYVVESDGQIMTLGSSDNIYFVNHRRFSGLQVKQRASICRLPFIEMTKETADNGSGVGGIVPTFYNAVVTEIAGIWLKVESTEQISAGEKVLMIFTLDKGEGRKTKAVKDLGVVRRAESIKNGYLLSVELKGCNDEQIEQLLSTVNQLNPTTAQQTADKKTETEEKAAVTAAKEGA
jgi:hypothetical protein